MFNRFIFLSLNLLLVLFSFSSLPSNAQDTPSGSLTLMSHTVSYSGRTYATATNQTTFTYIVSGTNTPPDLSHFGIEIPTCAPALIVVATSPTDAVSYGVDPTTGVNGIKWDLPLKMDETRTYTISFNGNVAEGSVQVAVKADSFEIGTLPGPSCITASINVGKFISIDGITWQNADEAPGLEVEQGSQVSFRFVITNIGNVEVTSLTLTDTAYDTSSCTLPAALPVGASAECTVGPFPAVDGQHSNTAVATAIYETTVINAADTAYYFSGALPSIVLEKLVSADSGVTWRDSTQVMLGGNVQFKLVVTNTGNVALSGITLTDDSYDVSTCTIPAVLEPEAVYECVIGPFPAGDTAVVNTATVTAAYQAQTVFDSDSATYQPVNDLDDNIIVVIEGPVQEININIVTIFDMDIEIDAGNPILSTIQVGDIIRVEGSMSNTGTTIIIVAINVVIVNTNIIIINPGGQPSAPFIVPPGCKLTGLGGNNPRLKCSGRSNKSSKKS